MSDTQRHNRRWLYPLVGAVVICGAVLAVTRNASRANAPRSTERTDTASVAPTVTLYDNLGTHRWVVTTGVAAAQKYFDQGLRLAWGFNHAEAMRSFAEGERLDSTCAMCAWGIAWAAGPNINAAMDSASGVVAHAAVGRALARTSATAPRERAVIAALAARYAAVPPADRVSLDSAYAREMRAVADAYPQDQEIQVLAADALMNLAPWNYWNADATPRAGTEHLLRLLEGVMKANPTNPGACHLFIHAVEAQFPARAVPCAERLASLMPGAGHIVHMPGHIYIRVGRFADAIRANEHAVHADESYIRDQRPGVGMYTAAYYPHNYDFLAFAAMMLGREAQSVQAAEKAASLVPAGTLGAPGMGFAQGHFTRHLQMKVRFQQWDAIKASTPPDAKYVYARAMWNYAMGRSLAARGDVAGATAHLERLRAGLAEARRAPFRIEFNDADAMLSIAVEVLSAYVMAASGDRNAAVRAMEKGVALEDALVYGEPPEWSVPARQDLGAVLLLAGRRRDARRVFEADLQRFPGNSWSTAGLAQANKNGAASGLRPGPS